MSDEILNRSKPNRATALKVLMPDGGWWGEANGKFFCDEGLTLPTEEQIQAKLTELQAEYDAQEYARNRSSEYPTWQEQMDMQYHDAKNGTNTWQEAIEAVKTKYPKGE